MDESKLFENKYLKYKNKYDKLNDFYNKFKSNYKSAQDLNRMNEYCYITNKKFNKDDLIMQCDECKNWGLAVEMIQKNNCQYCNKDIEHKIKIRQNDIDNILELIEDDEKDIIDIGLDNLKFSFNTDDDAIILYNKRLLGEDKIFNNSYNDYINSNNEELKQLLLYNTHNLINQIIPEDNRGTYVYHTKMHIKNEDNECLYCQYNKIL